MNTVPQEHDLNSLIVGTPEFSFSEGATSVAIAQKYGFLDLGNLNSIQIQNEEEKVTHTGSYRGRRVDDKEFNTKVSSGYLLRADEMKLANLLMLFFGSEGTAFTQSALTAQTTDVLDFDSGDWGPAVLGKWYDILVAGKRVRNLTTVVLTSNATPTPVVLVADVDYVLDVVLGRVRFLTAQIYNITGTVTAAAITSSSNYYMKCIKAGYKPNREGFGRLVVFDQNDKSIVVFEHTDMKCRVSINNQPEIDGETVANLEILVKVLEPAGDIFTRALPA